VQYLVRHLVSMKMIIFFERKILLKFWVWGASTWPKIGCRLNTNFILRWRVTNGNLCLLKSSFLGIKSLKPCKEREEKEFRWVSNTLARVPRFGPNVLPIFYRIFLPQHKYCILLVGNQVLWKHQCKFLLKSTRAAVHYASASCGTTHQHI
jgi:hypothetical protein